MSRRALKTRPDSIVEHCELNRTVQQSFIATRSFSCRPNDLELLPRIRRSAPIPEDEHRGLVSGQTWLSQAKLMASWIGYGYTGATDAVTLEVSPASSPPWLFSARSISGTPRAERCWRHCLVRGGTSDSLFLSCPYGCLFSSAGFLSINFPHRSFLISANWSSGNNGARTNVSQRTLEVLGRLTLSIEVNTCLNDDRTPAREPRASSLVPENSGSEKLSSLIKSSGWYCPSS